MTVLDQNLSIPATQQESRAWKKMKRNKSALAGLIIVVFFAVLAIAAPILPIADPVATKLVGHPQGAVGGPLARHG